MYISYYTPTFARNCSSCCHEEAVRVLSLSGSISSRSKTTDDALRSQLPRVNHSCMTDESCKLAAPSLDPRVSKASCFDLIWRGVHKVLCIELDLSLEKASSSYEF